MTNPSEALRRQSDPFRPKARIMELLGEQLIRSHVLALFELVKNSYDADAKNVDISLDQVDDLEKGVIELKDNGSGMSFETVTTVWMQPGNGHKADKRRELIKADRSERGRLPIGEKGVGRFAVHRLGRVISLVTRAEGKPEVVVDINWDEFLAHDFLDEAQITISERTPQVFQGDDTGTLIRISHLKNKWARGEVRKLYKQVIGMTTPNVSGENVTDFDVSFTVSPQKQWLEDLVDPGEIKGHALFHFEFEFNDESFSYEYKFLPFPAMEADYRELLSGREVQGEKTHNEFYTLRPPTPDKSWSNRGKRASRPRLAGEQSLGIGPIKGYILAFDLDPEIKNRYLKDEAGGITEFLKESGGIRVYRDGLRVYDYGEPGNDWLSLDHRRIQRPTGRLSNQIMLGELHLELSESFNLHEKTSREGFIENEAFEELRYAVICALTEFEAERNKDKRNLKLVLETKPGTNLKKLPKKQNLESLLESLNTVVVEKKLGEEVGDLVQKVGASFRQAREALLSSSGAGLGLVTVFHELERGVRSLHRMIETGSKREELTERSAELISMFHGVMYLVNKKSMEKIRASKLVELAVSTQKLRFRRHEVEFVNGFENLPDMDFEIKGLRRMLIASLVNLIDNAIYWADQVPEKQSRIWIGPSTGLEGPAIIVADNGVGFDDSPEELIEPFFSRKTEGMGIGLYYTDWVMRSHNGRLAFPSRSDLEIPSALDGAVVALVFNLGA